MPNEESPALFKDIQVIGELPLSRIASKLNEMDDPETAREFKFADDVYERRISLGAGPSFWFEPKPWQYGTHQVGYILPQASKRTDSSPIQYAGALKASKTLKNKRINIHLDRLRIYDYPGRGMHNILFCFSARNQLQETSETASFSQTYRVQEGQIAGVQGYPIFIGLNVGSLGVAFEFSTVNVKNDSDETILGALESPSFQNGLNLLTTAQPAIAPFTQITLGVAKALAIRNRNVGVQKFYMGLDFTSTAYSIRLAVGTYIAVQVPTETTLKWDNWIFSWTSGAIVSKTNNEESIPYNYVVFRITPHEE